MKINEFSIQDKKLIIYMLNKHGTMNHYATENNLDTFDIEYIISCIYNYICEGTVYTRTKRRLPLLIIKLREK